MGVILTFGPFVHKWSRQKSVSLENAFDKGFHFVSHQLQAKKNSGYILHLVVEGMHCIKFSPRNAHLEREHPLKPGQIEWLTRYTFQQLSQLSRD